MSAEIRDNAQPPDPAMRPPFASRVERVIQLFIDGEWVTKTHLGTGTVVACSAYEPESFEATNCVPILPSQPRSRTVHFPAGQESVTLHDWVPELVDIGEYPVDLPDFPSVKAIRQALLLRRQDANL